MDRLEIELQVFDCSIYEYSPTKQSKKTLVMDGNTLDETISQRKLSFVDFVFRDSLHASLSSRY